MSKEEKQDEMDATKKDDDSTECEDEDTPLYDLWIVECKQRGIGYMFQHHRREAIPLDQEDGDYGIGQILVDLADDIKQIKIGFDKADTEEA